MNLVRTYNKFLAVFTLLFGLFMFLAATGQNYTESSSSFSLGYLLVAVMFPALTIPYVIDIKRNTNTGTITNTEIKILYIIHFPAVILLAYGYTADGWDGFLPLLIGSPVALATTGGTFLLFIYSWFLELKSNRSV